MIKLIKLILKIKKSVKKPMELMNLIKLMIKLKKLILKLIIKLKKQ